MTKDIKMRCYSYIGDRTTNFTILFEVSTYSTLLFCIFTKDCLLEVIYLPLLQKHESSDVIHWDKGGKSNYKKEILLV